MKYDKDKIVIMAWDELGDEFNVVSYRIPFAQGELSDEELEAMAEVYLNRARATLNEEIWHVWYETSYKTSTAEREEEAQLAQIVEEYIEEGFDEEDAWDLARRNLYEDLEGNWW